MYGVSIVKIGGTLSLSISILIVALCLEYFEYRRCNPRFSHLQVKVLHFWEDGFIHQMQHVSVFWQEKFTKRFSNEENIYRGEDRV